MERARGLLKTYPRRAWWLVPVALTFVLYWRVLSLPLYWDDAPHFYFTVPHTWWQIWTNHTGYAYYRPLIFTFYKLAFQTLIPDYLFLAYGTSLAIHALNSVLVGKLASVLPVTPGSSGCRREFPVSPRLAGVLASVLFVVYPFSIYAIGNFAAYASGSRLPDVDRHACGLSVRPNPRPVAGGDGPAMALAATSTNPV